MWINDVAQEYSLQLGTGTYDGIEGVAVFNQAQTERYILEKRWQSGDKVFLAFMMNPSKASHSASDPTVDQMISLAKKNGCDVLHVVNVSSIIDGNSNNLSIKHFSLSEMNWEFIKKAVENASIVFISWGIKGQQGINTWLGSSAEASHVFIKAQSKLHAYEVLTAANEKIGYVPHPRPRGKVNKYINTHAKKVSKDEYSRLFREESM
ncbi:DUF1643 domain-containing protein [Lysinibacillus fusiformis]|uniref:DUF1643 domain-containing protein n=1 Tax=Lysinibacillus fusiformis TaxID=28031 RepID=UPI000883AA15|nr:DUF1643 domain-containing protein [Lysinibacillus fusiformis]SCX66922.1 Protein of unknown function [Lysinibacillus fusiformis]SDB41176.1 Protein of unknown function [Lysinibacillus fusiformis]SFI55335.1 Protein of unknown function [Lysinibacillus fusiformis]SFT24005.1 Protein of unknown function [Lysinibacillus fusiformis]